jgi:hypothetical protein
VQSVALGCQRPPKALQQQLDVRGVVVARVTAVAVAQGEGTLYHADTGCPAHKYGPNTGFFQPSAEVHNFRNEGSAPLVLSAFYTLPTGTPNSAIRADQPQPADCPHIP